MGTCMRWSIVAAVIVMALLLGIGYAQWAEQGSIIVAAGFSYIDLDLDNSSIVVDASGGVRVSVVNRGEEVDGRDDGPPNVKISVDGLYPGARATAKFRLVVDSGSATINLTKCNVYLTSLNSSAPLSTLSSVSISISVGDTSKTWRVSELGNAKYLNVGAELDPGDSIPVSVTIEVDRNATSGLQGSRFAVAIMCEAVSGA